VIPRSVKVGPHTYSVKIHPGREMGENNGDTDLDALEIRLRWGLKPSKKREILWHEIQHCCADIAKIQGLADEEAWVTAMSPIETQVLQENPQLVKFLTRDK
jgi:aconitase A